MNPLAKSLTAIQPHYDVVVVGSGYGGGIAASRLARCGRSVCLLERGREFLPGDFPKSFSEANREFQADLPLTRLGSRTALFDMRVNRDMSVLVGCGLGGTSLINGNVMLRPDPRVFEDPRWPAALRAELETELDSGYDRAAAMLESLPYPNQVPLAKYAAFETAAAELKAPISRPAINVTFEKRDDGNLASVVQEACTLCGDCCAGCNVGAKNTVQMNYLPDAVNHGAELFTCAAVSHVERLEGGWKVHYRPRGNGGGDSAPEMFVTADIVVLGAGTLGSTEILLRSRERGLPLSDRLGQNFSGNGDALAFGFNNDVPINGIGVGYPARKGVDPVGPVIAGLIDLRNTGRLEDGMVIQEGAIPSVLAPILPAVFAGGAALLGQDTDSGDESAERKRVLQSLAKGAYRGAVHNTQTFLVMAHDGGDGRMKLQDDRLRIDWPDVGEQQVFQRISDCLRRATAATGGTFTDNPLWSKFLGRRLVSVHPLGGCGLGEDAAGGVIDHKCRVFAGESGEAVHAGLYVCDGAIIPRSLGVNPSLTISALSERAMVHLAADQGWHFDSARNSAAPKRRVASGAGRDSPPLLSYSEAFSGEVALAGARAPAQAAELTLTSVVSDLEGFIADPTRTARLYGSAQLAALSPEPLVASDGSFNLYAPDPARPEVKRVEYRSKLTSGAGAVYFLAGSKDLTDDPGFDLIADLRTLQVEIREGDDPDGPLYACGTLKTRKRDVLRQLRSVKVENVTGKREKMKLLARFGKALAGERYESGG